MSSLFDENGLFLDIISDSFIEKHSRYLTTREWLSSFPFAIRNRDDFNKIPIEQFDQFVNEQTDFKSWDEMQAIACIDDTIDDSDSLL